MSLKRVLDVILALVALILFFPLFVFAAVGVRLKLGSPVIFSQLRPGLHGRPFRMYKFRTMREACDAQGRALPDADRLTTFGAILRSTSLDELPEVWNVLVGEMSIVGPRPLLMDYLPLYSAQQARRHEVRPGITGWAQINGRNAISWEQRFQLDVWYVDNQSTRLDAKIIARTFAKVWRSDGISATGHVTVEPFQGSQGVNRRG